MADAAMEIQKKLAAAVTARQGGRLEDELRLLDEALEIAPQDPIALNARGMRALNDDQAKEAADYFARAAEMEPEQPVLWMNLATAARAQGDPELERSALERTLDIDRLHFLRRRNGRRHDLRNWLRDRRDLPRNGDRWRWSHSDVGYALFDPTRAALPSTAAARRTSAARPLRDLFDVRVLVARPVVRQNENQREMENH